ncbi:MAG: hypothetical protein B7Z37_20690, partial [Verrucomicrobia bacterium 12-59-8]
MVLLPLPPSRLVVADEDPPPDPPPEEMWHFDHAESMMSISLQNSTGSVHPGSTATMQAYVENTSWEIWTSSFGNVQTMNYSSGPASYTYVSWYQDSGDGHLSSSASSTDSMGMATADFVMGNSQAVARVEVGNGTGGVASATLTLDPSNTEEIWSWGYSGSTITSVQWQDSAGAALGSGEQRTLTVTVTQESYDVWNSSLGNTRTYISSSGSAMNVPVTFSIQSGDGTLNYNSSVTTSTDWTGQASVTFFMGSNDTVVGVVAGDANQYPGYGSNVGFTASSTGGQEGGGDNSGETWNLAGTESSYTITMMADGGVTELQQGNQLGGFTAWVTTTTHDVYVSSWGNSYNGEDTTTSASGAPVWFMVEGDSSPFSTTTTDGIGSCHGSTSIGSSTTSVMGSGAAHIWAYVMDGSQNVLASTCWDISPVEEQWWHSNDETTLFASLSSSAAETHVESGTACPISVNVTYTNWEVWQSSTGSTELRNYTTGAAEGASVWFSLESGDGAVESTSTSTDSQGQATATFTMGQDASVLRVDSWFMTASSAASLNFTPPSNVGPVWNYDHRNTALDLEMLHVAGSSMVTARVSYITWDVYVLSTDSSQTENRNLTSSPAGTAQVSFSIDTGSVGNGLVWTDVNGDASTPYQTTADAVVTANVSFGAGMTQTGMIGVEANGDNGDNGQTHALTITTNSLPKGTVGTDYAATILASGGTAPYTFNQVMVTGENGLPFGYQLQNDGRLTGWGDNSTGGQQPGSYKFTVLVSDSASPFHTVEKQLTLVLDPVEPPPLSFTTLDLPKAMVGWGYNVSVPVQGGVGTLTFSASGLPAWLSLSTDGTFSGTPPASGAYNFILAVQDDYYDPYKALLRKMYVPFELLVQDNTPVNVTITSGDQQIIQVGRAPAAVEVLVTVNGAAVAGAEVGLGSQIAVTSSNGIASFGLPPLMTQGGKYFTVSTAADDGPTLILYAYKLPADTTGTSPEILPGPPDVPPVTPVENDEVIVESRWVST